MTEEERAELTAAKRGVTSRLLRADLGRYRLGETDSPSRYADWEKERGNRNEYARPCNHGERREI